MDTEKKTIEPRFRYSFSTFKLQVKVFIEVKIPKLARKWIIFEKTVDCDWALDSVHKMTTKSSFTRKFLDDLAINIFKKNTLKAYFHTWLLKFLKETRNISMQKRRQKDERCEASSKIYPSIHERVVNTTEKKRGSTIMSYLCYLKRKMS